RPLHEHGDRVPVDPHQIQRQVAQQLVAAGIRSRLDAMQDLRAGRRLGFEISGDDGLELLERIEDGEIKLREEVAREDETPKAVEHERLHHAHPSRWAYVLRCGHVVYLAKARERPRRICAADMDWRTSLRCTSQREAPR